MKRTQIYLTEYQHVLLDADSRASEVSKSELIRRILDYYYNGSTGFKDNEDTGQHEEKIQEIIEDKQEDVKVSVTCPDCSKEYYLSAEFFEGESEPYKMLCEECRIDYPKDE